MAHEKDALPYFVGAGGVIGVDRRFATRGDEVIQPAAIRASSTLATSPGRSSPCSLREAGPGHAGADMTDATVLAAVLGLMAGVIIGCFLCTFLDRYPN